MNLESIIKTCRILENERWIIFRRLLWAL